MIKEHHMLTFKHHLLFKLLFLSAVVLCWNTDAFSQEVQKKIKPKLRLSYTKYMDGQIEVTANAYYKKDKKKEVCAGASIGFYKDEDLENLHTTVIVDEEGFATLDLEANEANQFRDSIGKFNFYARLEADEKFKAKTSEITVLNANLNVKFLTKDSINYLQAKLLCFNVDSGKLIPGVKFPIKSYIVRALSLLPLSDQLNYTNAEGIVELEVPNDIPGDKNNEFTVLVRLEEDDDYGTVVFKDNIDWATPFVAHEREERSLAGNQRNAPLLIVITITATLVAVWGYIFYIIFGLWKIRKLGMKNEEQLLSD